MDGNRVKEIRQNAGLTQKEFAAEIGVSSKLIEMMEQGIKPCSRRTAITINLWKQVNVKKAARENPCCPFCKQPFEITRVPGAGWRLKTHQCTSGTIQIKSSFRRSKALIQRALTAII
jgi:DNA-binding XRE family transcriptional regulator